MSSLLILIRLIAAVLLTVIIFFVTCRNVTKNKHIVIRLIVIAIVVYTAIGFIPIENIIGIRFKTPEDAYFYTDPTGKILHKIEGKNSALLYVKAKEGKAPEFFKKDKNGWMIADIFVKNDYHKQYLSDYTLILELYRCRLSNECIIIVDETLHNKVTNIKDNQGTEFMHFEFINEKVGKQFSTYYGVIHVPDPNYELWVNESRVVVESNFLD